MERAGVVPNSLPIGSIRVVNLMISYYDYIDVIFTWLFHIVLPFFPFILCPISWPKLPTSYLIYLINLLAAIYLIIYLLDTEEQNILITLIYTIPLSSNAFFSFTKESSLRSFPSVEIFSVFPNFGFLGCSNVKYFSLILCLVLAWHICFHMIKMDPVLRCCCCKGLP